MKAGRLKGIKLTVAFFGLKATILIFAGLIGCTKPELRGSANEFIWHLTPLIKLDDLTQYGIFLALLLGFYYAVIGLGIWFLSRWVRAWVVVSFLYWFADEGIDILLDHKTLSALNSTPYFAFELVAGILILGYLFAPEVMQAFGIRNDGSDDWWEKFWPLL